MTNEPADRQLLERIVDGTVPKRKRTNATLTIRVRDIDEDDLDEILELLRLSSRKVHITQDRFRTEENRT